MISRFSSAHEGPERQVGTRLGDFVRGWCALASTSVTTLSGGFEPWSLIGEGVARRLLRIERARAGARSLHGVSNAADGREDRERR
jgi:hypothetical protein